MLWFNYFSRIYELLGDENTNFFHRFLAAKKRCNLISELIDDQGSLPNHLEWSVILAERNTRLISRFSVSEIKSALQLLEKTRPLVQMDIQIFNQILGSFQDFKNMTQILVSPALKKKTTQLLWVNAVKALLVEI